MPGLDRTGPMGTGPMTGGARGRCGSKAASDYHFTFGRRYGYRRFHSGGRGRFGGAREFRRGYDMDYGWYPRTGGLSAAAGQRDETEAIKREAEYLRQSLDAISTRIAELEKGPSD